MKVNNPRSRIYNLKRLKKNQKNSSLTGNRNSPLFTLYLSTIGELGRAMLNKDDMQRRIDALY